jgi:glycosyltransferase involved in cell wall biosynthesis
MTICDKLEDLTFHGLPHGVIFHPASCFNPAQGKPFAAIISHMELFPALHGFRVAVLQLAEFLRNVGYCTIWVNQAKADDHYIVSHQTIADRYFDVTFHVQRQTPGADAAKGDCVARETLECLNWIDKRFGIAVAIAEYAYMAPCLSAMSSRTLKLVQTIDVVSRLSVEDLNRNAIDFKRGISRDEEIALLSHADVLMAITGVEKDILQQMLPEKNVVTVGYSVTPSARRPQTDASCKNILFLASSNPFNRDAALTFIKEVLPKIQPSVSDCRLLLAGQVCSRLKSDGYPETLTAAGVVSMGPVDDVSNLYDSSAIVINPTRFGTGLKIKTVEAIAAGKPVVSTSTGCEGLPRVEDSPFLIADDADSFAAACTELLLNVKSRRAMEENALRYAEKYFSMSYVYGALKEMLKTWRASIAPVQLQLPEIIRLDCSASDVLKDAFGKTEVRIIQIGYPTQGMMFHILSSMRIVRVDSIPPISSIDELDYQWMNAGDKGWNQSQVIHFHRMTPEKYFADNNPLPDCALLYIHREYRRDQLLLDLCCFASTVREGGFIVVDGYGDINAPGITQAVDNFVFLVLPNISGITYTPSGSGNGWPFHSKTGCHTALIKVKSRCTISREYIRPMSPSPSRPACLDAQRIRLIAREKMTSLRAAGVARMAIFGAGAHTLWLEKICQGLVDVKITAILDDNPEGKAPIFGLKPVKADSFNPGTLDTILLSSDCRQQEMTLRCKHLYGGNVRLIDLYEGLPPGPYQK